MVRLICGPLPPSSSVLILGTLVLACLVHSHGGFMEVANHAGRSVLPARVLCASVERARFWVRLRFGLMERCREKESARIRGGGGIEVLDQELEASNMLALKDAAPPALSEEESLRLRLREFLDRTPAGTKERDYMRALKSDPANKEMLKEYIGFLDEGLDKAELAQQGCEVGACMHPEDSSFLVYLGDMMQQRNPDPRVAEGMYMRALQVCPTDVDAVAAYGTLLCEGYDDEAESAKHVVQRGLDHAPDDVRLLSIYGRACMLNKEPAEAEAVYRRAVSLEPGNMGVLNNYATLLTSAGRFSEAKKLFDECLQRSPADPTLLYNLGLVLEDAGEGPEAERCYHRAVASSPNDPDALAKLAWSIFVREGGEEEGKARELLERALTQDPSHRASVVCAVRALMEGSVPDQGEAERVLLNAIKLEPEDTVLLREYAYFHEAQDNVDAAEHMLRAAHELQPTDLDISADLARLLSCRIDEFDADELAYAIQKKRKQVKSAQAEAKELFEDILTQDPHHGDALKWYAKYLGHVSPDTSRAHDMYRRALQVDPGDQELMADLADMLFESGKEEEGKDMYRRAAEMNPNVVERSETLFEYGCKLLKRNDMPGACRQYQQAILINPAHLPSNVNLGLMLFGEGKMEQAREVFERVVALDPSNAAALYQLGRIQEESIGSFGTIPSALHYYHQASLTDPTLSDALARKAVLVYTHADTHRRGGGDRGDDGVRLDEAEELFRRAIAMAEALFERSGGGTVSGQEDKGGMLRFAQAYFEYGLFLETVRSNAARAEDMYERALSCGSLDMRLLCRHGALLASRHPAGSGLEEKGLQLLQEALKIEPADPQANTCYASYLIDRGWFRDARAHLDAALRAVASYQPAMQLYSKLKREREEDDSRDHAEGLGDQVARGVMSLPDGVQQLETLKVNEPMKARPKRVTGSKERAGEKGPVLAQTSEVQGCLGPTKDQWWDMNKETHPVEYDSDWADEYVGDKSDETIEREWYYE